MAVAVVEATSNQSAAAVRIPSEPKPVGESTFSGSPMTADVITVQRVVVSREAGLSSARGVGRRKQDGLSHGEVGLGVHHKRDVLKPQ